MALTHREEKILEAVIDGSSVPFDPITRREKIFAKAAGEDIELAPPITKEEQILSALAAKGSGGGSSDFSTAEVTAVDSTNPNYESPGYPLDMPIIGIRENRLDKSITFNTEGSIAHVALYNGVQSMEVSGIDFEALIDVEGNATLEPNPSNPKKSLLTITGNCTLIVGLHK